MDKMRPIRRAQFVLEMVERTDGEEPTLASKFGSSQILNEVAEHLEALANEVIRLSDLVLEETTEGKG